MPETTEQGDQTLPQAPTELPQIPGQVRSSTPLPTDRKVDLSTSLSNLQSVLRVAITSGSKLPELVLATPTFGEEIVTLTTGEKTVTPQATDDETISSICDVPALTGNEIQVKYLIYPSESEKTGDDTSELSSSFPFVRRAGGAESGTEGGDEYGFDIRPDHLCESSSGTGNSGVGKNHVLSGRRWAIQKQNFDDSHPLSLPIEQPTVAFSELQI